MIDPESKPINKLANLVTGRGWFHALKPIPEKVLERAKRQRLLTAPPLTLTADERFFNYTGAEINTCSVLGLRADFGPPPYTVSRTKAGWLWVLWCSSCNSVFTRRCAYVERLKERPFCPETCRKRAVSLNDLSKGKKDRYTC